VPCFKSSSPAFLRYFPLTSCCGLVATAHAKPGRSAGYLSPLWFSNGWIRHFLSLYEWKRVGRCRALGVLWKVTGDPGFVFRSFYGELLRSNYGIYGLLPSSERRKAPQDFSYNQANFYFPLRRISPLCCSSGLAAWACSLQQPSFQMFKPVIQKPAMTISP
jgi:hypothetical protein